MSHTPQLDATSTDALSSEAREATSRRTIVRGAVWAAPVVAATIAAPLAAASTVPTDPQVDLATVVRRPTEAPDGAVSGGGTFSGNPMYKGYRDLTFVATYRNNGPDTVPAGSVIGFGLAFAGYWDSLAVQENPASIPLTDLGIDTSATTKLEEDPNVSVNIKWWSQRVEKPLAPGEIFNLTYKAQLRDRPSNPSGVGFPKYDSLSMRSRSRIMVGSSGAVDSNAENNRDVSDRYFAIDNSASSRN
ncbi:hypothetical protein [Rathayibacter sp. VKM Ac-2805]|uniref:hypothetical protein n=1 Tax=Rathayibacter sp. VKM Ac-2805 TaxID=2609258 RepID=UPI00131FA7C0|nr:hypothetical protein [Rathayibacter sp. VKM Ac-2805]QHC72601.1 hypothetical protein GSU40_02060 [Rathayibacter sp. VKM Ac-2805]